MDSSNRLCEATERLRNNKKRGIAPYITSGDGGLDQTLKIMHALEEKGATCLELGIPFSDPIADGPILQAAATRSLESGTTLDNSLEVIQQFRTDGGKLPIAIMSYMNPLIQKGSLKKACQAISQAGADAILIPDLPLEESASLEKSGAEQNLATALFVAPTSNEERIYNASERSTGFLYVVGRVGITGNSTTFDKNTQDFIKKIRKLCSIPIAVGFGIRTREDIRAATQHADIAIVGTAMVEKLHASANPAEAASEFYSELELGLNQ